MTYKSPAPATIDTTAPHSARVWNYWLGGKDWYPVDQETGDRVAALYPDIVLLARAAREFLKNAVRYLAVEEGIRQFLDIGTGLPTAMNTHEAAQAVVPESRVVYVDNDPLVLAHARALLTSNPRGATDYIHADLHDPAAIIDAARRTLDLSQPVAITLIALLHAIPDADNPHEIVAGLLDAVPAGSYLAISHGAADLLGQELAQNIDESWKGRLQQQFTWRSREQVARFFADTDLVEPGLVPVEEWRPEPGTADEGKSAIWGAVGRKQ